MADLVNWLESKFAEFCDGEWEHDFGIDISTTSNPGWHIRIPVSGTKFEGIIVPELKDLRTETDWVIIGKNEGVVFGSGGPRNLGEILGILKGIFKS